MHFYGKINSHLWLAHQIFGVYRIEPRTKETTILAVVHNIWRICLSCIGAIACPWGLYLVTTSAGCLYLDLDVVYLAYKHNMRQCLAVSGPHLSENKSHFCPIKNFYCGLKRLPELLLTAWVCGTRYTNVWTAYRRNH